MRAPQLRRVIRIRWDDIYESVEWHETDSPTPSVSRCETTGTVTHWSKAGVVIVRTFATNPDGKRVAGDRITIPLGVIRGWVYA